MKNGIGIKSLFAIVMALLLGACQSIVATPMPMARIMPAKITATGNGSLGSYGQYNGGQQRLMAQRAAKVDAYRNLAEQVYGLQISGSTTINAFATQSDSVRAYVEAFLRGAKITNVQLLQDGTYEATAELDLPPEFGSCVVVGNCMPPVMPAVMSCAEPSCGPRAPMCVGAGCAMPSGMAWGGS